MMTTAISMFRCAKCGSSNVVPYVNGKKYIVSSFNIAKLDEVTEFRCPDCGAVLAHPMSEAEKAKIDAMVIIPTANNKTVDKYIDKYENIEINPVTHTLSKR